MAIVTTTRLREYLDQVKAGTAIDGALGRILERADRSWSTRWGLRSSTTGQMGRISIRRRSGIWSEPSRYLRLPPYRVGSITAIAVLSGTTITTTTVDGRPTRRRRSIYCIGRTAGAGVRYAVTAQFGYGPAPASIVELILELAVNIWRQRDQGLFQAGQGSTGEQHGRGGFLKYVGGLNGDQRRIVANVRRRYVEAVH